MSGRRRRRRVKPIPRPWWRLLDDMRRNMADAEAFLLEYRRAENLISRQACIWALWSKLMIIGEAAVQLDLLFEQEYIPPELRKKIQIVDRWALADERNRLHQNYWDVNVEAVVKAVKRFRAEVERIDESIYQEYLRSGNTPGNGDE